MQPQTYTQTKFLIDRYYLIQEHRIAIGNQIQALTELQEEKNQDTELLNKYFATFENLESELKKDINHSIKNVPIYKHYLKDVKGIGPILAASLISTINIHKAEHASSIWKYAGLDVAEDGNARSKRKEHLVKKTYANKEGDIKETVGITFNPFLKKTCWLIGESFVKTNGKYRQIYNTSKQFYDVKFPNEIKNEHNNQKKYTKLHKSNMSKRRTTKLFLSELYVNWRTLENLPVSTPFAHRIIPQPDHSTHIDTLMGMSEQEVTKKFPKQPKPEAVKS